MSSNISEDDLNNFCAVTGAPKDRARFYVEAANGNLDLAIESYFENGGAENAEMETESPVRRNPAQDDDHDFEVVDDDDADEDFNPFNQLGSKSKEPTRKQPTRAAAAGKIFSLNDMNNDNDDEEDEDEKGQAFYAGGSKTSGQQILGPKKRNPEKIIKDLFEKAKEHGAQEVESSDSAGTSKKTPKSHGPGYRLGSGNEPSEVIPGAPKPRETKSSILKLWKNGFNIDDGDLRSYEDPKHKEFLASIQRGELPRELIQQAQGGEVHLDMQDHRDEEFVPPKQAYKLYSTEGQKLGSEPSVAPVVSNASANDKASNEDTAKNNLGLDASKPTTQMQLRLSDGSRLIIKANLTHKLREIKTYLNTARPEYATRNYSLMTSFPNKELTNDDETVEEAKLQNASIIQKLK